MLGLYNSGRLSELVLTFHARRVVGVSVRDILMSPAQGGVGTMAVTSKYTAIPLATGVHVVGQTST